MIVVGDSGVGKTKLVQSVVGNDFDEAEYEPTDPYDFTTTNIKVIGSDDMINAQIWDIGGNYKLGKAFLKETHAVILVVDMTSKVTLLGLNSRYETVRSLTGFNNDQFPCVLVGTKADLLGESNEEEHLTVRRLHEWATMRRPKATDRPITVYSTSSKTMESIQELFTAIITETTAVSETVETDGSVTSMNDDDHDDKEEDDGAYDDRSVSPSAYSGKSDRSYISSGKSVESESSMTRSKSNDSYMNDNVNTSMDKDDNGDDTDNDEAEDIMGKGIEDEENENTIQAKVLIAGAPAVGKTSILKRFSDGDDTNSELLKLYDPTIGADFQIVHLPLEGKILKLQIWDTAGDRKLMSIGRRIFHDADFLILVYDMTSHESFEALEMYWNNFMLYGNLPNPDTFPVLVVGNKCDVGTRATTLEEVVAWCENKRPRRPLQHLECSALRSLNVNDIFLIVSESILDDYGDDDSEYDSLSDNDDSEATSFIDDGTVKINMRRKGRSRYSTEGSVLNEAIQGTPRQEPNNYCYKMMCSVQ